MTWHTTNEPGNSTPWLVWPNSRRPRPASNQKHGLYGLLRSVPRHRAKNAYIGHKFEAVPDHDFAKRAFGWLRMGAFEKIITAQHQGSFPLKRLRRFRLV